MSQSDDTPYLLTPGPLTTAAATRRAMLRDWGSRSPDFIALTARVRARLVELAGGGAAFTAVPVQGSGTFAIEAALGTLVPRDGRALVLVNGGYGRRMVRILEVVGRGVKALETPEDVPNDVAALDWALAEDGTITHVAAVHCETTSGILNPIASIAEVTQRHGRRLIVDAMSAFGALPLDAGAVPFDAVVASANKCLEGVPGVAFAVIRRASLEAAAGNAPSLALDLHDQWRGFEGNGQWRFTPPTHVLAALDAALEAHRAEGGTEGRLRRYRDNCRVLVAGLRRLGFETLLPDALQAPIIVTVRCPKDPAFSFAALYQRLAERGYLIYPGKVTMADTFRIGCIGAIDRAVIEGALEALAQSLAEMGVTDLSPARAA